MRAGLEFFLGLLEHGRNPCVAWEDLAGPHGKALRLLQRMGFIATEPGMNPVPSCPYCLDGSPYRLGERFLCNSCYSTVELHHLQLWPVHLDAFLDWLAEELQLQGTVRSMDGQLWQLGSRTVNGRRYEVFFKSHGALTEAEKTRLAAYRNVLILYGLVPPAERETGGPCLSLLEVLELGTALTAADLSGLLGRRGAVHFDAERGALWIGDMLLGEVPVNSREHALLACLAGKPDTFVPYTDLKHFILQHTGSRDTTEEATFCQKLKSRIKQKWISQLDQLIITSNKADGYRLRGTAEL